MFTTAIIVILVAFASGHPVEGATSTAPPPSVIIPAGADFQLSPRSYAVYEGTFHYQVIVSGNFSSTLSVVLYIMTPAQFGAYESGSGKIQAIATFTANVGHPPTKVLGHLYPGSYYFVIVNPFTEKTTFSTSNGFTAFPEASSGSSGIPEFPFYPLASVMAACVVVAAYVLMRRAVPAT